MVRVPDRPLTPEQADLAARFAGMAYRIAADAALASPGWIDAESLRSDVGMAVVRSAARYRPGRMAFRRYLRRRIEGVVADAGRRPGRARELSRRREMPADVPARDRPVGHEIEDADDLEWWLRRLPRKHAAAMRRIYLHGDQQREAGRAIGVGESRVGALHKQSLSMLKQLRRTP